MKIAPLSQFMVHKLIPLELWGVDISLTNSGAFMVGAVALIILFFACSLSSRHLLPKPIQSVAEMFLQLVRTMISESNGAKGIVFLPFVSSVFLFVFMGNVLGMVPFSFTFTSQIIVNFALALLVLLVVTIYGIGHLRGGFFRVFFAKGVPWWVSPILVPVEVISYLSRPVSLAVRLFANMVAGHSMMKIFAYFTVDSGPWGAMPFVVNMGLIAFEFLVAFLQAYVFAMLSCVYLNDALHQHH